MWGNGTLLEMVLLENAFDSIVEIVGSNALLDPADAYVLAEALDEMQISEEYAVKNGWLRALDILRFKGVVVVVDDGCGESAWDLWVRRVFA